MKYLVIILTLWACNAPQQTSQQPSAVSVVARAAQAVAPLYGADGKLIRVEKSDADWKKQLTPQEYNVLREKGTERAFSGDLRNNHEKGIFVCAACGLPLFSSETKFESGTGWPSFYKPITDDCIRLAGDSSYGMTRTEVECARCGGHQGHVFDDGPKPTGLRYCINSVSLNFVKQ